MVKNTENQTGMSRRSFLTKSAVGASGLILGAPSILSAAAKNAPSDTLNIALLGAGKQGDVLFEAMKNLPGLNYQAVCDINSRRLKGRLNAISRIFGNEANGYERFEDLIEKEKGLDVIVIATPDFWHAPHTIACLESGLNVYCEKMMSNTIEGARSMVRAVDKSGKLCQIGHQRRSNPRYLYTYHRLLNGEGLCGKIVNINGQWNRSLKASKDIKVNPKVLPSLKLLKQYGFKDHHQYLNWRWYRDLSGGPISDLGAHQIDIFNWFLGTQPKSVMASGGNDYFDREHFDNVMAIFEYEGKFGKTRAFYQVLTTTSAGGGYSENFMGTTGTINISENPAYTKLYRESDAPSWDNLVARNILKKDDGPKVDTSGAIASYASAAPDAYSLPGEINVPPHQPHLLNFFNAVRGKAKLNCDARHALESEAPIFWVNPSALSGEKIHLTEKHLAVV